MTAPRSVVLVVESDIVVRHPLTEYLRDCGFVVFEAADGFEAMSALSSSNRQIDIVLADMTTPGSGFALRQWIQAQAPNVEVILAGSVEKSVDRAGTLCNEGPALVKPYAHHLVLDHIRQALARRARRSE
jgi:DNA-binding response OmpR family regulator